jgi:thiamine biosynthesis protein ThiS
MASVHDLITTLALDTRMVAIEHNGAIIPRSAYGSTTLAAGDRIEIVGFVGGG